MELLSRPLDIWARASHLKVLESRMLRITERREAALAEARALFSLASKRPSEGQVDDAMHNTELTRMKLLCRVLASQKQLQTRLLDSMRVCSIFYPSPKMSSTQV